MQGLRAGRNVPQPFGVRGVRGLRVLGGRAPSGNRQLHFFGRVVAKGFRVCGIDMGRPSGRLISGRRQENAKTASKHLAPFPFVSTPYASNGKRGPPPCKSIRTPPSEGDRVVHLWPLTIAGEARDQPYLACDGRISTISVTHLHMLWASVFADAAHLTSIKARLPVQMLGCAYQSDSSRGPRCFALL